MDSTTLELLKILVPILLPPLVTACGVVFTRWYNTLPQLKQARIDGALRIAIYAAEQLGQSGQIQNKKQYALLAAQEELSRMGISPKDLNVWDVDRQLEAMILHEFNEYKETSNGQGNGEVVQQAGPG